MTEMTQAIWDRLTMAEKEAQRDTSALHPMLAPYLGKRVKVTPKRGEGKRSTFRVGMTTGWRPVIIAIKEGAYGSSDIVTADEQIDTVIEVKVRHRNGW